MAIDLRIGRWFENLKKICAVEIGHGFEDWTSIW
jgi:hypothetical protein